MEEIEWHLHRIESRKFEKGGLLMGLDIYAGTLTRAKFAFSILWQAVSFSMEHQVPVLMDF